MDKSWSNRPTIWSINLQWNTGKNQFISIIVSVGPVLGIYLCCLDTLSSPRKIPSNPAPKWNISSWLLTWYFVCWRFTLVTVRRTHLPYFVQSRDRWKQLRCILNIQILTKEDSIFWFDLCGWLLSGLNPTQKSPSIVRSQPHRSNQNIESSMVSICIFRICLNCFRRSLDWTK